MTSVEQLNHLMGQALADKAAEPAFFRALLEARVYAHAPKTNRSGRLCLIQFKRPDGLLVVPFFSDEAQAKAAAGTAARIVRLSGRQLFQLTRSATLMLNPNGTNCTLYPEEIAALLDRGDMAIVEQIDIGEQHLYFDRPKEPSTWLIDPLISLYGQLVCVEAAYLAEVRSPMDVNQIGLLIALAVQTSDAERSARATITALQPHCHGKAVSVDLTTFEPSKPPEWLSEARVDPFYIRSWGTRAIAVSDTLQ
jgi:hypothetical protein